MLILENIIANIEATTDQIIQNSSNDSIIGIGGIIATVVVGLLTCLITWRVTLKTVKQQQIDYNIKIQPILSNQITSNISEEMNKLEIKYNGSTLTHPFLLSITITNTGNCAIINPPIKIKTDDIEIIPGYFEELPPGYEDKWTITKISNTECNVNLEHINKKQSAKLSFFLNDFPKNKIRFECPMPDVQIRELNYENNNDLRIDEHRFPFTQALKKSTIILIIISIVLFLGFAHICNYLDYILYYTHINVPAFNTLIFVIFICIFTIVLDILGTKKLDRIFNKHRKLKLIIYPCLILVSIVLLFLIINDILIYGTAQIIVAIGVAILISLFLHFIF